jgi:HD-GYP domain-containing protein (c-di-GMP phosphodiesterase class II)
MPSRRTDMSTEILKTDAGPAADAADGDANPHYVDRVVSTSASHNVEAAEDILAADGTKLLARGARIDAGMRERLLARKLRRPLEASIRIVDGVIPEGFGPIAERLLDQHPLLRALCDPGRAQPVPTSLANLRLTVPMQALLTVYCQSNEDRLQHTVGVAMLALGLARRVLPGAVDLHRSLSFAGLVHDVGELYIDPVHLQPGHRLDSDGWRHIVAHPVIGHRVLVGLDGAGRAVAEAVLDHHERLDGHGYPRGIAGAALPVEGQVLAAAEWLMALVDRRSAPLAHAQIVTRLIDGEFSPAVLDELTAAARSADEAQGPLPAAATLVDSAPRVARIAESLRRCHAAEDWIQARIATGSPALRRALSGGLARMQQIRRALAMTGLDAGEPGALLQDLADSQDPRLQTEVLLVLRELEWRLRDLERSQRLQAAALDEAERAIVLEAIARVQAPPDGT